MTQRQLETIKSLKKQLKKSKESPISPVIPPVAQPVIQPVVPVAQPVIQPVQPVQPVIQPPIIDIEMERLLMSGRKTTQQDINTLNSNVKVLDKHHGLKGKDKRKLAGRPTTTYIVTMIFGNGSCKHFVVEPDKLGFFTYLKKKYHLNQKNCIWDANNNTNRFYFHENYVEPVEFKEINVELTDETRMITSVTPENIDGVIKMESLRLIAEGPDLQRWVKIGVFVSIGVAVLLGIILIIFLAQSGIFQQMSGAIRGASGA